MNLLCRLNLLTLSDDCAGGHAHKHAHSRNAQNEHYGIETENIF